MTAARIEITESDMGVLTRALKVLGDASASLDHADLTEIELHVVIAGQRFVIGYGESAEPAVIAVADEARESQP